MNTNTIRLIDDDDTEATITTICTAFADDPAFNYFFPTPEAWQSDSRVFVGALLEGRRPTTWVIGESGGVAAVSMWSAPTAGVSRSRMDAMSADGLERLRAYNDATSAGLPDEPFWYLGILATNPEHAGKRLGRQVMDHGLRAAGETGIAAYLETTNPGNVALYERCGWSTTASTDFEGMTIWVMRHDGLTV